MQTANPIKMAVVKDIQENYATGYISLFRSIRKHWVWQDAEKFKWWVDILLEVNHKQQKVLIGGKLIECNRGQSINSLLTWAKRWRTNVSAVRRFLKLLESDTMIVLENVSKTTRLTVCKYDSYQTSRNDNETILKSKRNEDETEVKTNNNDNNSNNVNKREQPALPLGFYENEIANNQGNALLEKYKALVDYLHGKNDEDLNFTNVLKLSNQLSFKQYLKLRDKSQNTGVDLREVLKDMENKPTVIKGYKSLYLTINGWANVIADKKQKTK